MRFQEESGLPWAEIARRLGTDVDEAGVLYAHTLDIADADGIPFSGASDTFNVFDQYTYR